MSQAESSDQSKSSNAHPSPYAKPFDSFGPTLDNLLSGVHRQIKRIEKQRKTMRAPTHSYADDKGDYSDSSDSGTVV